LDVDARRMKETLNQVMLSKKNNAWSIASKWSKYFYASLQVKITVFGVGNP
jgi:hypothetical protein